MKKRKPVISPIFATGSVATAVLGVVTKNKNSLPISLLLASFTLLAQIGEDP